MRSKLALAALLILSSFPVLAQVSPAAKVGGLPLSFGFGVSDYGLDYGQGRRMIGLSATGDYSVFHGIGVECEGTTIFADKPDALTRMKQSTIKGGAIYKYHPVFGIRPYVKALYGLGSIDFPSRNPLYTHDTYNMWALGGGAEYRIWSSLYVRGDYEYQTWPHFQSRTKSLDPNGFTVGADYYLRGFHKHY